MYNEERKMRFIGKSFEPYREAIPAFRMACEAMEFEYQHPNYKQTRSRYQGSI